MEKISKHDMVEKYLESGKLLRVGEAFDNYINTTELRCIVSRLRREYREYNRNWQIKTIPIEGKRYCNYQLVKLQEA